MGAGADSGGCDPQVHESRSSEVRDGGADWPHASETSRGVRAAFARVVREAVSLQTRSLGPARAIHEFRKRLRQVRALLRLCRADLIGDRYLQIEARLRHLGRRTSAVRDTRVLLDTLSTFKGRSHARTVNAVREELMREVAVLERRDEEARVLERAQAELAAIGAWIRVSLPAGLAREFLARSLAHSMDRVRRARRRAKRGDGDRAIHRWRKRTKELRYQLELLPDLRPRKAKKAAAKLDQLAQAIGGTTDLVMLCEYIDSKAAELAPFEPGRLVERVRRRIARRLARILDTHRGTLDRKPRELAARVVAPEGPTAVDRCEPPPPDAVGTGGIATHVARGTRPPMERPTNLSPELGKWHGRLL
ncbi:MAG: CHAD domain-containing protein [Planctomycetota bacterium]